MTARASASGLATAESFGVLGPQIHPEPGPAWVRTERPAGGVQCTVKEHALDPLVIVEVLDMAQVRHRRADVRVQVRRAMGRHIQAGACRQRRRGQEAGDEGSGVAVTVVQMPAVNTPQFSPS